MIKATNISHYYNSDPAIKNLDIEIQRGEFACIVGESGSGKSTLLSILSTLLTPTQGSVSLNRTDYTDINNIDMFRRENIGFIFQFHYLIEYLSVLDNVRLANQKASYDKIEALLKLLNIQELIHKYPNEISGGEKQRVAIARALINDPKVVFADEPTGNLDSKNSLNVFLLLKRLSRSGTTVIVTTHDKDLAALSDKIYEVKDGQLY